MENTDLSNIRLSLTLVLNREIPLELMEEVEDRFVEEVVSMKVKMPSEFNNLVGGKIIVEAEYHDIEHR